MNLKKLEQKARFYNQIQELPLKEACEKAIADTMSAKEIGQMAVEMDLTIDDLIEHLQGVISGQNPWKTI